MSAGSPTNASQEVLQPMKLVVLSRSAARADVGPLQVTSLEWLYMHNRLTGLDYLVHASPPTFLCTSWIRMKWSAVRVPLGRDWQHHLAGLRYCLSWHARARRTFRCCNLTEALVGVSWFGRRPRGSALDSVLSRAEKAFVACVNALPMPLQDGSDNMPDEESPRAQDVVRVLRAASSFVIAVPVVSED